MREINRDDVWTCECCRKSYLIDDKGDVIGLSLMVGGYVMRKVRCPNCETEQWIVSDEVSHKIPVEVEENV